VGATALPSDARTCNIGIEHLQYYTCLDGRRWPRGWSLARCALLQEAAGRRLTPDQVQGLLRKSARPPAGYGEWEVGSGYLDALAAVGNVMRR
jgi:hypothetical protein